ncbi:UNVERIFIED_CONTAM: diguanylate cyclase [Bacteroidetes bacterium 56_B9]
MSDKEKILIADDSAMNRAILTEMLGDGYEILEAENGRQAVAILQSTTDIDLLLLDIMMPEMDGFEVLAMMNKYHWIDEVPVIMISAENASSYVERAYDLGATDYISRPFDMAVVRRRVINTLMLYAKQKRLVRLVAEQVYEKEKSNSTMINILSHIVEFRNGESGMHVLHIQTATDILLHTLVQKTDKYHLTAADISLISTASALHDIGKINIPESILNKPGRLTKEEFEVMKTHTTIGSEILEKLPFQQESDLVKTAYAICRWHHERWDGRGYPDGLKGEQIPIAAQVVSMADVYDALTSERCYKKAFDHDTAVKMILNGECGQFNPLLLECLTECGAQLHAELSIASDTGSQLHRLADAQHISDALLRENALPGQNHIVQSLSRLQQKGRFFNQSVRCIQFDYDVATGHLSFSAWAAEHMGVPKDLLLPDEVEEIGFPLADIARIQKALRATSAEHPYTELSMLLPVDGELRWHHVRLCSLWSDDSVPAYIGAVGQADPAEQFFDYHYDLYHDVLTNAYNRRFFEKQLRKLVEVDAIAMLDLDQFKQINDVYGHQAGDDALRILVSAVTACVRNRNDALVRYGGDEFLLIFPHIPEHVFIKRLEQIRATVQALHMIEYPDLHLTVSIGGVYGACPLDPGIRQADKLLYQAKECRNKCITAAFSAEEAEKPKPNQESDKL